MISHRLLLVPIIALIASAPTLTTAATIEQPLDGLTGDYFFGAEVSDWSHGFIIDLGVSFTDISSVRLQLTGTGQCPGDPCLRATDFDVRFTGANLPLDLPVFISPINIGPFDGPFFIEIDLPFNDLFLDGVGAISLSLGLQSRELPELGPSAPGSVSAATLLVSGQVVPEPGTSGLILIGLCALGLYRRSTRR